MVVSLTLLILSCSKNEITLAPGLVNKSIELTPEEYASIAFDTPRRLNDDEVIGIVKAFLTTGKFRTTSSSTSIKIESAVNISTRHEYNHDVRSDSADSIPIVKVNISSSGSEDVALVCADERSPVVVAYFGKQLNERDGADQNKLLLEAAKEVLRDKLHKIEHLRDSLRRPTLDKIAGHLSLDRAAIGLNDISSRISVATKGGRKLAAKVNASIITDPGQLGTPVAFFGPFMKARWDQGMPYNRTLPQVCSQNWLWDNRYAVSSVAVSTAQLFSFLKPAMAASGQMMNWAYLTENAEIHETSDYFGGWVEDPLERKNMVANLMKEIGTRCAVSYTCTGSSVNYSNVLSFIRGYNIRVDGRQGLSASVIKQSIENVRPILMYGQTSSGGGHWWVVDGMIVTRGYQSFIPNYNIYVHANMGLGSYYSGYYLIGSDGSLTFDASFANFNSNLVMYPNIEML